MQERRPSELCWGARRGAMAASQGGPRGVPCSLHHCPLPGLRQVSSCTSSVPPPKSCSPGPLRPSRLPDAETGDLESLQLHSQPTGGGRSTVLSAPLLRVSPCLAPGRPSSSTHLKRTPCWHTCGASSGPLQGPRGCADIGGSAQVQPGGQAGNSQMFGLISHLKH